MRHQCYRVAVSHQRLDAPVRRLRLPLLVCDTDFRCQLKGHQYVEENQFRSAVDGEMMVVQQILDAQILDADLTSEVSVHRYQLVAVEDEVFQMHYCQDVQQAGAAREGAAFQKDYFRGAAREGAESTVQLMQLVQLVELAWAQSAQE